jgi:hypothetical protein
MVRVLHAMGGEYRGAAAAVLTGLLERSPGHAGALRAYAELAADRGMHADAARALLGLLVQRPQDTAVRRAARLLARRWRGAGLLALRVRAVRAGHCAAGLEPPGGAVLSSPSGSPGSGRASSGAPQRGGGERRRARAGRRWHAACRRAAARRCWTRSCRPGARRTARSRSWLPRSKITAPCPPPSRCCGARPFLVRRAP